MGHINELDRQLAVLAAWRTILPADQALDPTQACWPSLQAARLKTDATGLRAYQINAQATAQRVLASTYPTIAAMLGADTLSALALILWQQDPPRSGDLGEWGGALPASLASHPDLQPWPWLADSARLDWHRHLSERAADATLDAGSLQLLGEGEPEHVRLWLKPCVRVLPSNWPVIGLWDAHQLPVEKQEEAAAQALAHRSDLSERSQGQVSVSVVWRNPWPLQMLPLTGAQADWMLKLVGGRSPADIAKDAAMRPASLASLLDQALPDFDFTEWLSLALSQGWLWRVTVSA